MIEILAAIYIVKAFYNYAKETGRTGWLYGVLGFVLFYGIAIGVSVAVYAYWYSQNPYEETGLGMTFIVSIISILIAGGITMYVLFPLLKKIHTKSEPDMLDSELLK